MWMDVRTMDRRTDGQTHGWPTWKHNSPPLGIKRGNNCKYWWQGYSSCIMQFSSWPSISVSGFIKLPSILLEICSGQKCDRQTDGLADRLMDHQTDKAATICSAFGEHKDLLGRCLAIWHFDGKKSLHIVHKTLLTILARKKLIYNYIISI